MTGSLTVEIAEGFLKKSKVYEGRYFIKLLQKKKKVTVTRKPLIHKRVHLY